MSTAFIAVTYTIKRPHGHPLPTQIASIYCFESSDKFFPWAHKPTRQHYLSYCPLVLLTPLVLVCMKSLGEVLSPLPHIMKMSLSVPKDSFWLSLKWQASTCQSAQGPLQSWGVWAFPILWHCSWDSQSVPWILVNSYLLLLTPNNTMFLKIITFKYT